MGSDSDIIKSITLDNGAFFEEVLSQLSAGKRARIPVKGCSMLPFIRSGRDTVELEALPQDFVPQRGDILLFLNNGSYVLHRFIRFKGDALVMMGDGNASATETCQRSDVLAKVILIYRGGTRPVNPYSAGQRVLSSLWRALRPVRRYLLFVYKHIFKP